MKYKKITAKNKEDILLPNEAFDLFGQMHVNRVDDEWTYETELFEQVDAMVFPEEKYNISHIQEKGFAIGAYSEDKCVGLAIFEYNWSKYLFLYDLKVNRSFRKKGVATELIKAGQKYGKEYGYKGIYTIGQDNNLGACKFYLKQGFKIGGLNTHSYRHTSQAGKYDIYFYLENRV